VRLRCRHHILRRSSTGAIGCSQPLQTSCRSFRHSLTRIVHAVVLHTKKRSHSFVSVSLIHNETCKVPLRRLLLWRPPPRYHIRLARSCAHIPQLFVCGMTYNSDFSMPSTAATPILMRLLAPISRAMCDMCILMLIRLSLRSTFSMLA
jgi:hypothetical protein